VVCEELAESEMTQQDGGGKGESEGAVGMIAVHEHMAKEVVTDSCQ
jgi:hypothetical protein